MNSNRTEEKNRRKGLIFSVVLHTTLILLLAFFGLSWQSPPPEPGGILVNLGIPDVGQGDENAPKGEPAPPVEEVEPEPVEETPPPKETKPEPKKETKPKPTPKKEVKKTEDPNAAAIRKQKEEAKRKADAEAKKIAEAERKKREAEAKKKAEAAAKKAEEDRKRKELEALRIGRPRRRQRRWQREYRQARQPRRSRWRSKCRRTFRHQHGQRYGRGRIERTGLPTTCTSQGQFTGHRCRCCLCLCQQEWIRNQCRVHPIRFYYG